MLITLLYEKTENTYNPEQTEEAIMLSSVNIVIFRVFYRRPTQREYYNVAYRNLSTT